MFTSVSQGRLAHNQALFRQVDERIAELGSATGSTEFICECSDPGCIETIELELAQYERVRSNSTWFLIERGHQGPEIERIMSEDGTFAVVEKFIAEEALVEDDRRSDE
jgi:hypothetical protein